MIAMKNATDNAKEIASKLEIQYHRARQQAITEELIDVINGSNV
ncbi:MAG: F0F1 ATP synthase subunit gamma [Acholeplasmataceae bacterium]